MGPIAVTDTTHLSMYVGTFVIEYLVHSTSRVSPAIYLLNFELRSRTNNVAKSLLSY